MAEQSFLVYVTSFCEGTGDGLWTYRMDVASGQLAPVASTSHGVHSPLYAESDPARRFLFVADYVEECDGAPGGAVCAYAIDGQSGRLTFLNRRTSCGEVPCYVSVTHHGKYVLVANYGDGCVSVLPVSDDGQLGDAVVTQRHRRSDVDYGRQRGSHAHAVVLDPSERFALAANLGADQVLVYRIDATTGNLEPSDPPLLSIHAGAGPRHIRFHPNGRLVYVINELDNTLVACVYDGSAGALTSVQTVSTLPAGFAGTSFAADIHIHPNGQFLYGSNRVQGSEGSIVIFAIDEQTGRLSCVGYEATRGEFPRGFAIDPTGAFLLVANERSDNIVTFRIDSEAGGLSPTEYVAEVSKPACISFPQLRRRL